MAEPTKQIICADCGKEIIPNEELYVGMIVECQNCGTEMEILSLDPLKYGELIEEK